MKEMLNFRHKIHEMVEKLELTYPFVSVLVERTEAVMVSSATNEDSVNFKPPIEGFVMRAFSGKAFYEYVSSSLDNDELESAYEYFIKLSKRIEIVRNQSNIDPGDKLEKIFEQEVKIDPIAVEVDTILDKVRSNRLKVEKLSELLKFVSVMSQYTVKENLYINRNKKLYQQLNRFDSVYSLIFSNDVNSSEIYGGQSLIGGFEHSDLNMQQVERKVRLGERLLNAERIEPGFYDCIFAPDMSGMLAHEAFGHGMEADMFLKNRAKGSEYIGKKVASDIVNMSDSPALYEEKGNIFANGSYFFDDEGMLSATTHIIKDGVLLSGITDMNSATKLGIKRTPNGRAQNFMHKVYARMTNTYFENGKSKLEDMIKSIDHGYLISQATNGMEDPKGWGMQLEALAAEEIKDGKLTGVICSPIIVTGYVPDILMSISAVSEKFEIASLGYCGKGSKEWVKVTDGGPYLKLKVRVS